MSGAHSGDMDQGEQQDGHHNLKSVFQEFLRRNHFLHEFRVQKLVYLADLVSKLKRGERLTDADFKPYMYGSYSEDLRNTINNSQDELPTGKDRHYGNVTTVFYGGKTDKGRSARVFEQPALQDEEAQEIIEAVLEAVDGWRSEELGDWSKESWLYENTPYDEEMDFDRLEEVDEKVKEELVDTFPELEPILFEEVDTDPQGEPIRIKNRGEMVYHKHYHCYECGWSGEIDEEGLDLSRCPNCDAPRGRNALSVEEYIDGAWEDAEG